MRFHNLEGSIEEELAPNWFVLRLETVSDGVVSGIVRQVTDEQYQYWGWPIFRDTFAYMHKELEPYAVPGD